MEANEPRNDDRAASSQEAPQGGYQEVRDRLRQIAEAVEDPELSLDAALDLYEEAVTLGLKASDLLEVDITAQELQAVAAEEGAPAAGDAASADAAPESQEDAAADAAPSES